LGRREREPEGGDDRSLVGLCEKLVEAVIVTARGCPTTNPPRLTVRASDRFVVVPS
jgi:hypothetical protein